MHYNKRHVILLRGLIGCVLIGIIFSISSCSPGKNIPYFRDIPDSLVIQLQMPEAIFTEPLIRSTDILQIYVQTIDPKTTDIFSDFGKATSEGVSATAAYRVDKEGNIELPVVGIVHVGGLTLMEARELIRSKATKYYIDPVVNLRFLNFYVTVLGDIGKPGRLNFSSEKINILDAIAAAGDLSLTAKRDNILLVREENGKKIFARYDIGRSDLFQSPYYYLKSGDIIYVEPNKVKAKGAAADYSRDRYISYFTTLISLSLALYSVLRTR